MKSVLVVSLVLLTMCAAAEKQPFERYQSILDRQMFGPLPKDFDPTKMPSEVSRGSAASERELTKEQEQLQSAIHFSVINVGPDGKPVVGFTDNSDPKMPVHYYMRVGETQNGWLVKEANSENATMTIVKDDVEVSLTLGDNSAQGGGKTAAAATPRQGGLLAGGTLSSRRALRMQAAQAEERKRAAEAAEKEAARQAEREQEKAEREAERVQQRQQLMAIQEELRKAREEKERAKEAENKDEENVSD